MTNTIRGLVDAGGCAGVSTKNEWRFVFNLAAWREFDVLTIGNRRCELPVEKSEVHELMARVRAYDIVDLEIDPSVTGRVTKVTRLLAAGLNDPELENIASALRKPITATHPLLGLLEYQREYGRYVGRVQWQGRQIDIALFTSDPTSTEPVFQRATRVFTAQRDWSERLRHCIADKLLPLKNGTWLEEDETAYTEGGLLERITLQSIHFGESGRITFWHADDDLFAGHDIEVRADEERGVTEVGLAG